jgi:putative tryptophan/tyrosine transport system substrate-binding protein
LQTAPEYRGENTLNITELTKVLAGFCLALGILLGVRGDVAIQPPQFRLVYLGTGSEHNDAGFQRLRRELQLRHPQLAERISLGFASDSADSRELAAKLRSVAEQRPDLILAPNGRAAAAARQAAPDRPLVFGTFADPVRFNIVTSLEPRQEPATGVWISDDLDGKRLEILRDAYPWIRRVAILGDQDWGRNVQAEQTLPAIAAKLGLELTILYAQSAQDGLALARAAEPNQFDAWCLPRTGITVRDTAEFVQLFAAQRKALIVADTSEALKGAPLSYALDASFAWPALADLVARVLEGEPAGSIPIERPSRFVLAVRADGLATRSPPSADIMRRADLVIR